MITAATGNTFSTSAAPALVIEQDALMKNAVVQVIVRSGSLSDPDDMPGLANLVARAMLRGTQTKNYPRLTEAVESIGGSLEVRTDREITVFTGSVIAVNFNAFMMLVSEIMSAPAFDDDEVATLKGIVKGELLTRMQQPKILAAMAALGTAFAGHKAANATQGTVAGVDAAGIWALRAFHRERYVRSNMLVACVSPYAVPEAEKALRAAMSVLPPGTLDARSVPAPVMTGRRAVIVEKQDMSTTPLFIALPGVAPGDKDMMALEVGNFVFGADFTSRLIRVLRVENGWTYGAYSGFEQLYRSQSSQTLFSLYTYPSAVHAARALPKAFELLEAWISKGLSEDEFAAARDALSGRYAFNIDTPSKRLDLRVAEVLGGAPFMTARQYDVKLSGLARNDVNAVIEKRLKLENVVIAAAGDGAVLKPVLEKIPGVLSVDTVVVSP